MTSVGGKKCAMLYLVSGWFPQEVLVILLNNQMRKPKLLNVSTEGGGEIACEVCPSPEKGLHRWLWQHGCTKRHSLSWKHWCFQQHCAMDLAPSKMPLGIEVRPHILSLQFGFLVHYVADVRAKPGAVCGLPFLSVVKVPALLVLQSYHYRKGCTIHSFPRLSHTGPGYTTSCTKKSSKKPVWV